MRDTALACLKDFAEQHGSAPTPQELFDIAWAQYDRNAKSDVPGKPKRGPHEMMLQCIHTVERFHQGRISSLPNLDAAVKPRKPTGTSEHLPDYLPQPNLLQKDEKPIVRVSAAFPIDPLSIPPRDWVVPGLLLCSNLSLLVAPPGVGKSLLTLQIAIMVASGISWAGWRVRKRGNVMVINAEDDHDEMMRRLYAAARTMNISQDELGGIYLVDDPENIIIAKTVPKTSDVVRTPMYGAIVERIEERDIMFTIADPLLRHSLAMRIATVK